MAERLHERGPINDRIISSHVAKKVKHYNVSVSYRISHTKLTLSLMSSSAIAWEIPTPSFGDVALPNSSIRTNAREEAMPKIIAQDAISLANVLRFFSMSSSFERRVRRWLWILKGMNV